MERNEGVVAEWGSQHGEALTLRREGPVPNPDRLLGASAAEVGDCWRLLPGSVPDASLALVETDPCPVPQGDAEGIVQGANSHSGVDVLSLEERENGLTGALVLQVAKRVMLHQGVKGGHQGVALFAFALTNITWATVVIPPRVDARRRVKIAERRGGKRVELASGKQTSKHRIARDVVERANCVD
eukprot:s829_g27.t1